MLFASLPFLLGFLPACLAVCALALRLYGAGGAMVFLAGASFVFYGWHHPPSVLLLASSVAFNFVLARRLSVLHSRLLLALGVGTNLALLGYFKYVGFFADSLSAITGSDTMVGQVLLPLGISFFTFQQIAYLVDVHRREVQPGRVMDYVFFVAFFPQLIAGPIVHHRELMPQLSGPRFARFRREDLALGAFIFAIGLGKKVLIADSLRPYADLIFQAQSLDVALSMTEAWAGMTAYAFQIYFDFSGYGDMAIGLGLMFGLRLPVNFRAPYKAASIIDFWRRWNITLSHFLRDYLYFPLGGNRGPVWRRFANLWVVMLLGGLWHGAGWQFVIWGGLHGAYLSINHGWRHVSARRLPRSLGVIVTFLAVLVAWVFFRAESFDQAFDVLAAMAGRTQPPALSSALFADPALAMLLLALTALAVWRAPSGLEILERIEAGAVSSRVLRLWFVFAGSCAALSVAMLYAKGSYAFIYFQF